MLSNVAGLSVGAHNRAWSRRLPANTITRPAIADRLMDISMVNADGQYTLLW